MAAPVDTAAKSGDGETTRSYHNNPGVYYFLPNDTPEHARLESQAFHLSAAMNHQVIHAAVQPDASRILDVGCGTGAVTIPLGKQFPNAKVYGLDFSPVPNLHERPPNVRFLQGNVMEAFSETEGGETLARLLNDSEHDTQLDGKFDFIFNRLLLCGMDNWPGYVSKVFCMLKPGGYVEMHELDYIFHDANNNVIGSDFEWLKVFKQVSKGKGLDLDCGSHIKTYMKDVGLQNIQTFEYRGLWSGEGEEDPVMKALGEYTAREMPEVLHLAIAKNLHGRGYTEDQIKKWQADMRYDTRPEPGKHMKFIVTVGQKPLSE